MRRIAILLPINEKGKKLRYAKNLACFISSESKKHDEQIEVVFGCNKDAYNIKFEFADLMFAGIQVREVTWKSYGKTDLEYINKINELSLDLKYEEYCMPKDGLNDFLDCDMWLIISEKLPNPIFPIRKHYILSYGCIQKFVECPGLDTNRITKIVRNATGIIINTHTFLEELVCYYGIKRDKIFEIPFTIEKVIGDVSKYQDSQKEDYITWVLPQESYGNHEMVINAFIKYYEQYNGRYNIKIICLFSTYNLKEKDDNLEILSQVQEPHLIKMRELLRNESSLYKKVKIINRVSYDEYLDIVSKSKLIINTNVYGNDVDDILDASQIGTSVLCVRHPFTTYIDKLYNLELEYYEAHQINELAYKMKMLENDNAHVKIKLNNELCKFSWENVSTQIYKQITKLMEGVE